MTRRLYHWLLFVALLVCAPSAFAQGDGEKYRLGIAYFEGGEFDKAEPIFHDLIKKNYNPSYYPYYFNSLLNLKKYEDAEKIAKTMWKKYDELPYLIDIGNVQKLAGKPEKAEKTFSEVISNLPKDEDIILQIADRFSELGNREFEQKALQKGSEILGKTFRLEVRYATVLGALGKKSEMIDHLLDAVYQSADRTGFVQDLLQQNLGKDDYDILRSALLKRIQKYPDFTEFNKMLIWYFVQQLDFQNAFIQSKALVKRLNEDGSRLFSLALLASANDRLNDAITILEYIIGQGKSAPYYMQARMEILKVRKKILSNGNSADSVLRGLDSDYLGFFSEYGYTQMNIPVQQEYASFLVFRLDSVKRAIRILENSITLPGLQPKTIATLKLDLGDYYLMDDQMDEAALTYGQVDKAFKEDAIGREAKYRNARLSFYQGDFEWSQGQLDVLKAATSQRISNDAIFLDMLIIDNLGMDSNYAAMELFAKADLFAFRLKKDSALFYFQKIVTDNPGHSLTDEAWFATARMYERTADYKLAFDWYKKILDTYAQDIWADDALFRMAMIARFKLKDDKLAKELFEKLITTYPNSTFAVDARKHFRQLRGDAQEQELELNFIPFDSGWSI